MSHVEPDGLPVDAIAPALRDALTDVSVELVDGQHTAHGTLGNVARWFSTVRVEVIIPMDRSATDEDVRRIVADLGGYGAPVLVRGLAHSGGANGNGDQGAHERRNGGEDGSHGT